MTEIICKQCNILKQHYAKGLCTKCYDEIRCAKRRQTQKYQNYHKQYYQNHKNELLKRFKKYYQEHYDEMRHKGNEYGRSLRGREVNKKAKMKYNQTQKGKETNIRKFARRRKRNLNWIKLWDNPFPDDIEVHWHHINDMLVVPMPAITHDRIISIPIEEHRERANLQMYYLYGNLDIERLTERTSQ